MARPLAEDDTALHSSGEEDSNSNYTSDLLGEKVLEAFLYSALENDQVLRKILDAGMTQIIRGAIRLFNLQRGRDRGHSRGNKEERPVSSLGENVLESFLDYALENDTVLRGILDEGLTQIIRGAIRLFNLQRGRDGCQSQGHRSGKRLAPKCHPNLMNFDDGLKNSAVHGSNSKGSDNNPPIVTMTTARTSEEREEEESLDGSPHDIQQANCEETRDNPLEPEQEEEEIEIVTADKTHFERQPIPPSGGPVGPLLVPAKKGAKRKRAPPKTTGKGRKDKEKAPKPFTCYFCQKSFQIKQNLESHLRTHTKEAPFICHHCGKECSQHQSLKNHIRRHLKEKPFKCPHPDCPSSFTTNKELQQHSRVHSGSKPFSCNLCGKGVTTKQSLEDHIRRHLKEKWFKCPQKGCSSSFVNACDLKSHARVHSGEKPFSCPYPSCGKHFAYKQARDDHHRTHTGEKPFVCGCGKLFATTSGLHHHRRICEEGDRVTKKRRI